MQFIGLTVPSIKTHSADYWIESRKYEENKYPTLAIVTIVTNPYKKHTNMCILATVAMADNFLVYH
jgi:hypothetical protein